jgi:hypothetical protein
MSNSDSNYSINTSSLDEQTNQEILSLDDVVSDEPLILVGAQGTEFKINRKAAFQSSLIKNALTFNEESAKQANVPNEDRKIKLDLVNDDLIQRIVDYMEWHHANPDKITDIPRPMYCIDWNIYIKQNKLSEWDNDFMNRFNTHDELIRLINAANYIGLESLLNLSAAKIAQLAKKCFQDEKEPLKAGRKFADMIGNTTWKEEDDIKAEEEFQRQEKEKEEQTKREIEQKRQEYLKKKEEEKKEEKEKN